MLYNNTLFRIDNGRKKKKINNNKAKLNVFAQIFILFEQDNFFLFVRAFIEAFLCVFCDQNLCTFSKCAFPDALVHNAKIVPNKKHAQQIRNVGKYLVAIVLFATFAFDVSYLRFFTINL